MENPEHLAIFKSGVDAWNNWREEHPEIQPNLSHADLAGKDLTSINFKNAVLTGSNLLQSTLTKANLVEANLSYALLFEANLETANLTRSDLMGADLAFSKLKEANLSQSVLRHANLTGCDLSGGILRKADLMYTVICSASLIGVDVTSASFLETIIVDTDLTKAKGLATCEHLGPSVIDYRTLLKSKTLPQTFLKACGIPFEIIEALMRAKGKFVSYSTFIGYGEPDRTFAERLHLNLSTRGVSCWMYSLDATVGKPTWREITEKRRSADRIIIICSAKALRRPGVLKEIEDQIDDDPDKLIPIDSHIS